MRDSGRSDAVRLVELSDACSHHAAAALFARIWHADSPHIVVSASTMTAVAHAGGYVAGAYRGDELIGAAVGFLGRDHLHSHVTGVALDAPRGLGYRLKQHQRAWCLERGIGEIRWTFDPLVARNAYFNLHRLGARVLEYLPDFYGPLADGVNTGDTTDRLYVAWDLRDPAVPPAPHAEALRRAGAVVLVDRTGDLDPPVVSPLPPALGAPLLVAVPRDIEALRTKDPELAGGWRRAIGVALPAALAAGYRITGASRDGVYTLHSTEDE